MFTNVFLFVTVFPNFSWCANILGIMSIASYSHQVAFRPLWRELSLRGHKVTLITTDPVNDKTLTNLSEIDVHFAYKVLEEMNAEKFTTNDYSMLKCRSVYTLGFTELAIRELADPHVQDLIHNRDKHFDVVLVEALSPEFLAFGRIYKCPVILISSMEVSPYIHYRMGNHLHLALYQDYSTVFYGQLDFKERFLNSLYNVYLLYYDIYIDLPIRQVVMSRYFPNVTETVSNLLDDVDMLFVNSNPVAMGSRALRTTTITISGGISVSTTKQLSEDLQEYLDGAKNGFIYFSLGTNAKSAKLKPQRITAIIDTFKEIPLKILWKFEADILPNKPENVKLIKWAPQEQILRHPNIKLFITQGGLQSLEEAVSNFVPLVVIPCYGDQLKNSKMIQQKGLGIMVNPKPILKKKELKQAIIEVINNSSYREAVKKFHQLSTDWPMNALERAVWWTEYVIRHNGTKHLRNPITDMPTYQYLLLDVLGFLILVVLAFILFLVLSVKFITRIIKRLITTKLMKIPVESHRKNK